MKNFDSKSAVDITEKNQAENNKTRKKKGNKKGVTAYANLGTEEQRLKYLGFRDDVMARAVVARKFNNG